MIALWNELFKCSVGMAGVCLFGRVLWTMDSRESGMVICALFLSIFGAFSVFQSSQFRMALNRYSKYRKALLLYRNFQWN